MGGWSMLPRVRGGDPVRVECGEVTILKFSSHFGFSLRNVFSIGQSLYDALLERTSVSMLWHARTTIFSIPMAPSRISTPAILLSSNTPASTLPSTNNGRCAARYDGHTMFCQYEGGSCACQRGVERGRDVRATLCPLDRVALVS